MRESASTGARPGLDGENSDCWCVAGWTLKNDSIPVKSSHIVMRLYRDLCILVIGVCLTIDDADSGDFMLLRRAHDGEIGFSVKPDAGFKLNAPADVAGSEVPCEATVDELCAHIVKGICDSKKQLGLNISRKPSSSRYLAEVRGLDGLHSLDGIGAQEKREIYGMLTGDSDWRHVSSMILDGQLGYRFSNSDRMCTMNRGDSLLLLRLDADAVSTQYGDMAGLETTPEMDEHTPGLWCGLFFTVIDGMAITMRAEEVVHDLSSPATRYGRLGFRRVRESKRRSQCASRMLAAMEAILHAEPRSYNLAALRRFVFETMLIDARIASVRDWCLR